MTSTNTAKPKLACEIAADRVLAGRVMEHGGGLEASAARELAPGSVVPDLVESNLRQRAAVREGIEAALGPLAAAHGTHVEHAAARDPDGAQGNPCDGTQTVHVIQTGHRDALFRSPARWNKAA